MTREERVGLSALAADCDSVPADGEALDSTQDADESGGSGFFVQSLARGLAVIDAFDADHPALTLIDVSRRTGINRAAARRFVLTLAKLGYLRTEGRYFSLTSKVLNLGYAYLSALEMPELAIPHLRALAEAVGESSFLSILEGDETVCVANVPVRRIWSISLNIGTRLPAVAMAAGRVLLAAKSDEWLDGFLSSKDIRAFTSRTIVDREALHDELKKVRQQGWALVDREFEEGVRTMAVPVRGRNGVVSAAISVSKLVGTSDNATAIAEILPPLQAAGKAIEADLYRRL
jgi:IclR family transcriptional regulator, pca regulon regulatory protein